jgi:hypothetical protein
MQSANSSSVSRIRNGTNDLQFHTNGTLALTLASNQAATFSSSVTAGSFIPTSSTVPTNGMYLPSANTLGFSANGIIRFEVASTGTGTFSTSSREWAISPSGQVIQLLNTTSSTIEAKIDGSSTGNSWFGATSGLSGSGANHYFGGNGNYTAKGSVTATSFIRSGGTSSQYLMADGSISTLSNTVTGTGVAGQVAYWSSGSAITGESNLFWDSTNDRLGINITSPQDKLDVIGEVLFGSQTERLSIGSASLAWNRRVATGQIYDSGRFAYQFQHTGSTTAINDFIALQVYNNSGGSVTPNALVVNGSGNVLIGTTTDTADKLRVVGTTFTDAIVTMRPSSTTVKSDVWKLGRAALATSSVPEDIWVRVQIGTKNYDLLAIDRGTA